MIGRVGRGSRCMSRTNHVRHGERCLWINRGWADRLGTIGGQGYISLAAAIPSIAVGLPDPGTEWFADAEPYSHGCQDHQQDDGDLDEDSVPLAHPG
jgi:hypothetical protein